MFALNLRVWQVYRSSTQEVHFCIIDEAHVLLVDGWELLLCTFESSPDPAAPRSSAPRTRVLMRQLRIPLEMPSNYLRVRCAFQSQPVPFPDCSPPFTRDPLKTLLAITYYPRRIERAEERVAYLLLIPTATLFSVARDPSDKARVPWAAWGAEGARTLTFRGARWFPSVMSELDVVVAGARAAVRVPPAGQFDRCAATEVLFLDCHAHAQAGPWAPGRHSWNVSRAALAEEGVFIEGEDAGGAGGLPLRVTRRRFDFTDDVTCRGVGDVFGLMVRAAYMLSLSDG